ncbi:MAG: TetR/AcrR family transcriptional regulator [Pseudonocardia sp.]|nr:TetR/AcrR family transcriptional regulator [Pseudonocardia sp.]
MDPRARRTRESVLRASRELLLEGGLDVITHAQVATRAQVGRRTMYRHWPSRHDLLHDTLAGASFPTIRPTGDLRADVRTHLEQLRDALVHGPLAVIVLALGERSASDPDIASLRARLVEAGCAPLRELLGASRQPGAPAVDTLIAELEGPLFYTVCIQGRVPDEALIDDLVDRVLASHPADGPLHPGL